MERQENIEQSSVDSKIIWILCVCVCGGGGGGGGGGVGGGWWLVLAHLSFLFLN